MGSAQAIKAQPGGECGGLPVTMRHMSPASLAFLRAPAQTRHFGAGTRFIDDDELAGIKIKLSVKPGLARGLHIFTLLLAGMRRLFLKVMPRFLKNSQTVEGAAETERSDKSRSAISERLMSRVSSTRPRMKASWASSLEPGGWPCLRAAISPVSRKRRYHVPAVEMPMPNRFAALRVESPPETASILEPEDPCCSCLTYPFPRKS